MRMDLMELLSSPPKTSWLCSKGDDRSQRIKGVRMSDEITIELAGATVTGRRKLPSSAFEGGQPPLIVAVHGGGFTSAYFDCDGYSLLERAAAAGVPSIAIDRPGYAGSTPLPIGERAVPRNAELLQTIIARIWRERDFDVCGVVLVGHSIGSAISLYIASAATDWPLLGVAFSGLGTAPPSKIPPFWTFRAPDEWVHTPSQERLGRMFGPSGTFLPGAAERCDSISQPVWWREIVECYTPWAQVFPDVCSRIGVPIHYRHGDLDHLWENGQDQINRFAGAFANAPQVDAKLVPNTGHCIDFHLTGKEFQEEEIAFAISCAA